MALRQVTDHVDVTCGVNGIRQQDKATNVYALSCFPPPYSRINMLSTLAITTATRFSRLAAFQYCKCCFPHRRHVLRLTEGLLDCVIKDRPVNVAGKHRSSSDVHF
jgi:hypothetical protein